MTEEKEPGPAAMRGLARKVRSELRSTADWMQELREGEQEEDQPFPGDPATPPSISRPHEDKEEAP